MKSCPTVIHVTQASRSGAALYVRNLAAALETVGAPVWIVCPRDFAFADDFRGTGRLHTILPSLEGASSRLIRQAFRRLKSSLVIVRFAAKHRSVADVMHINFPGWPIFAMVMIASSRWFGLKCCLTVHDVVPHRFLLPRWLRSVELAMLRGMYSAPDILTVHYEEARSQLYKQFSVHPARVLIVPHGANRMSVPPMPIPAELTVLAFGTIRPNKGYHLAITAVQELRSQGRQLRLIIAGRPYATDTEYWQRCKALIQADAEGIEVHDGYVEDSLLAELVGRSHAFLLPYTDFYSQSGVASVALANDRCIIATNSGGLSDFVGETMDSSNILIREPTPKGVADALEVAINLGVEELRRRGQVASREFNRTHSWESVAERFCKVYRQIRGDEQPEA